MSAGRKMNQSIWIDLPAIEHLTDSTTIMLNDWTVLVLKVFDYNFTGHLSNMLNYCIAQICLICTDLLI